MLSHNLSEEHTNVPILLNPKDKKLELRHIEFLMFMLVQLAQQLVIPGQLLVELMRHTHFKIHQQAQYIH